MKVAMKHSPNVDIAQRSFDSISRVMRPIRVEWPKSGGFFVAPSVVFAVMVVITVLAFLLTYLRARRQFGGY